MTSSFLVYICARFTYSLMKGGIKNGNVGVVRRIILAYWSGRYYDGDIYLCDACRVEVF